MATSSAACLEEVRKLRRQLCQNCLKIQLNDRSQEVNVASKHSDPIGLGCVGEGYTKMASEYSLSDEFPALPKLKVSSRQGCTFCGYLREMILSKHTVEFTERQYGINTTDSGIPKMEVTIRLSWILHIPLSGPTYLCASIHFKERSSCITLWSTVTAAAGSEELTKWLPIRTSPNVSPSYPYNIEEMKSRIHQCKMHNHPLPSLDYAPKRLLDIRGDYPRLISGSEALSELQGQTPRYAALSYCWGTSEEATDQLTTTRETMPERQRGIWDFEMPPVLRDAVYVTKSLDIPFLWVDALCISQGDTSDWEIQCAQMDSIYGHAEVTLVASSSNSCRDSFLYPESRTTLLPFSSKRRSHIGGLLQVTFSGCTDDTSSGYFNVMRESRLATRGWAVQERILSTRMIIFGLSQVQFVCPYESGEDDRDRGYLISRLRGKEGNDSSHVYWTKLLDEYRGVTGGSFTQATDLLPALSGLAAYFGSLFKDRYCAGHWHKDLYRSLLWGIAKASQDRYAHHVSRVCSPSPYIIPSWSRLGKGDSHAWDQHLSGLKQETLDAHISHAGQNPFGAIRYAQLEVRTHTMFPRKTTNIKYAPLRRVAGEPVHSPSGCWVISLVQSDKNVSKHSFSCCVWLDYDASKDPRGRFYLWKWVLLGDSKQGPFGLLLSSANDSTWCRVGIFTPFIHARPEGRPMRLDDFIKFSSVETVMII